MTIDSQRGPHRHVGTGVGFVIIALATVGIVMIPRSPTPSGLPAPVRTTSTTNHAARAVPCFDAAQAAKGKDLHARMLVAAGAHESYRSGSLWGALMSEPKASISVPLDAWKALSDDDRSTLMHYAASLVECMKADPLGYSGIPATAPAASRVRANAMQMAPTSWVIQGGRLHREATSGPFDILSDEVVASGSDQVLTTVSR